MAWCYVSHKAVMAIKIIQTRQSEKCQSVDISAINTAGKKNILYVTSNVTLPQSIYLVINKVLHGIYSI